MMFPVKKGVQLIYQLMVLLIIVSVLTSCNQVDQQNTCGGYYSERETSGAGNTNDTITTAEDFKIKLTPGCYVQIEGYLGNDQDHFKIDTGNASSIKIRVTWNKASDDLSLYLMDSFGNAMKSSSLYDTFFTNSEQITYQVAVSNHTRFINISSVVSDFKIFDDQDACYDPFFNELDPASWVCPITRGNVWYTLKIFGY